MQLHRVSQRKDGKYEFTAETGPHIRPVGYCTPYKPIDFNESVILHPEWQKVYEANAHKYHDHGHDTPEEAADCYRSYMLDHNLVLNIEHDDRYRECRVCSCLTNRTATIGVKRWPLCEEHNNREEVEKLYTLSPTTLMWEG